MALQRVGVTKLVTLYGTMSDSKLNQIVKGAPPPGTPVPTITYRSSLQLPAKKRLDLGDSTSSTPSATSNVPATLTSSPPQIYLNLLILEASLRSQYLHLRDRRRQNTFFLFLLFIWITGFSYLLLLHPREDGSGVGGSVYWVIETGEKVALMGGVVTGVLVWGTGQWDRGMRWPRRWVGITNRGLRSMNAKVVIIKGPWWKEILGHLSFLFLHSSFFPAHGSSYLCIDQVTEKHSSVGVRSISKEEEGEPLEEDLSPGGDYIKLLLLPKPFSPDFRVNWELYRLDYWEKENERRAHLRELLRNREKEQARRHGAWFWWIGWPGRSRAKTTNGKGYMEKSSPKHQIEKEGKKPTAMRSDSQSRDTLRSSTPVNVEGDERPTRIRRGSASWNASEQRKKVIRSSIHAENGQFSRFTPVSHPA